jgi:hypothetical protein
MVEQIERPLPWLLRTFFGRTKFFETKQIEFDIVDRGRRMAPFVAPEVAGKPMVREGYRTRTLAAAIHQADRSGRAGSGVHPSRGRRPVRRRAVAEAALRPDRCRVPRPARRDDRQPSRMDGRAGARHGGDHHLRAKVYPKTHVDFGRDASLTVALTGGAKWDQSTATPLVDIETNALLVRKKSKGAVVTDLVMDGAPWNLLKKNAADRRSDRRALPPRRERHHRHRRWPAHQAERAGVRRHASGQDRPVGLRRLLPRRQRQPISRTFLPTLCSASRAMRWKARSISARSSISTPRFRRAGRSPSRR